MRDTLLELLEDMKRRHPKRIGCLTRDTVMAIDKELPAMLARSDDFLAITCKAYGAMGALWEVDRLKVDIDTTDTPRLEELTIGRGSAPNTAINDPRNVVSWWGLRPDGVLEFISSTLLPCQRS